MGERLSWGFLVAIGLLKPLLILLAGRRWIDGDKIPADGGFVLAANHVSHLDPLTLSHLLVDYGRLPRFLGKDALWDVAGLGSILRNTGQIPVSRMSGDASNAYREAVRAVGQGRCVVVYPEGSITRDPDGWPMRGKTGAARIALESGCAVVPVAQVGVEQLLPAYSKRLAAFPRKTIQIKVGDPVDLDDLRGVEMTHDVLHQATDRIMAAITALAEDLRGAQAPAVRFDPKAAGTAEIGNFKKGRDV